MRKLALVVLVLSTLAAIAVKPAGGYVLNARWPSPQTTMNIGIGAPWDDALVTAMGLWSSATVFKFSYVSQTADPCSNPNKSTPVNGVKFSNTYCDGPWGQGTLAITTSWLSNGIVTQAGISFNSSYSWNVYDGPFATGMWAGVQDFRRVAVHELGHVIGLGHEDSVPAIMATFVTTGSTITRPQADDIAGVTALYGGAGTTDSTGPTLVITSQSSGQSVTTATITLSGTASDAGRGDNGVASVTVNGVRASGDTASGGGTAAWSQILTLSPGTNSITVIATDNSPSHNTTTVSISITLVTSVTASTYHVFPQFADGNLPDGTYYRSTLMITNPNADTGASCSLRFFNRTSSNSSLASYTMGPAGWIIAPSGASGSFQSGHATLQCTVNVEAQLLYSFYSSNGAKLSEATVFSSPSANAVKVLADQREGSLLGLAIANDTDQTVSYTIVVYGTTSTGQVTLGPRSSIAKFLNEFIPSIPANFFGQVLVYSNTGLASIIGLRYTGTVFTTIPESIASSIGPTASTYHVFPQFADGKFSDGTYYRTTRAYINPSTTSTANCTTRLRLTTGGGTIFTVALPPGDNAISSSSGTGPFQQGYATQECSSSVDSQILYSYYSANGVKLGEATVFSSPAASRVQILADSRDGARVGLAIANNSDQANTYLISVYDAGGNLVGSTNRTISARTSIAAFINEFVTLPANHVGPVIVSSTTGNASIIGLRFTGATFTTIPEVIR